VCVTTAGVDQGLSCSSEIVAIGVVWQQGGRDDADDGAKENV
jgi:hypothetical protein